MDSKINLGRRRNFLNDRVIFGFWNKFPTEVKTSSSLNVFIECFY